MSLENYNIYFKFDTGFLEDTLNYNYLVESMKLGNLG